MIVIPIKDGENIERALKRFKRKFEKTGAVKELRGRQAFEKPSITRRTEIKKAIYIEQLQRSEENSFRFQFSFECNISNNFLVS
jgi:small subunit ribosomal protein S21